MVKDETIKKKYQKKDPRTHILDLPDTYVGSIEKTEEEIWVWDDSECRMIKKNVTYSPALYKIFDEILVNAIDHYTRLKMEREDIWDTKTVTEIKVNIDQANGEISVYNDGDGVDVTIHPEHKVYVPELIFGHLLSSTNYDKDEIKIVGGKNGYGAKLTNIFSKEFILETVDRIRGKKYKQVYKENMSIKGKPTLYPASPNPGYTEEGLLALTKEQTALNKKITKMKKQKEDLGDLSTQSMDFPGKLLAYKKGLQKVSKPYTKVTFKPDYARFGLEGLTDDMAALMKKRVYDATACTGKEVSVYLNGKKIDTKIFEKYVDLYIGGKKDTPRLYEKLNDRWELVVAPSTDNHLEQISFVNGINTIRGGKHVEYVVNMISKRVSDHLAKKKKNVKPNYIRDNMMVFINCTIENPSFDSQTKETLTTVSSKFGSKIEIPQKLVEKIVKTSIVDRAMEFSDFKENKGLKKTDGKKKQSIRVNKLDDANLAGTSQSDECTLILTEGDSAKAFAIAGLSVVGRDKYGVFPLRGKVLNVREASVEQMLKNKEINHLKQILGLQQYEGDTNIRKVYKDTSELRYGHIMIMTDQDVDGSHIKGLIMNMFHYLWPSLLKIDGFLTSMITPIVKVKKNKEVHSFYTLTDYNNWKAQHNDGKGWDIKYYKGLGTSTSNEAKDYFKSLEQNKITYSWTDADEFTLKQQVQEFSEYAKKSTKKDKTKQLEQTLSKGTDTGNQQNVEGQNLEAQEQAVLDEITQELGLTSGPADNIEDDDLSSDMSSLHGGDLSGCDLSLNLAFDSKFRNDRKFWLKQYDREKILTFDQKNVTFNQFVHKDLIHFSNYDNERSIPCMVDGFKPSQRKVLYAAILRNLKKEMKVAQFAGYISEKSSYHHGEASLMGAIIGMAQDFVGSNNINYLEPNGQFGTRLKGGDDSASPRYIYTAMTELTQVMFSEKDKDIVNYLNDDGFTIEPEWYVPCVPTVLINGAKGIGTGFSTDIPCYNPMDCVKNIYNLMDNKPLEDMFPWYRSFKGEIEIKETGNASCGLYKQTDDTTIEITELPVGVWTEDYKEFLDEMLHQTSGSDDKKEGKKKKPIPNYIKSYENQSTESNVRFILKFNKNVLDKLLLENKFEKEFKLVSSKHINTTNMHLYDRNGKIKKYKSPNHILKEYYDVRLEYYGKRKEYMLNILNRELVLLSAKIRFIKAVIAEEIVVFKKKKSEIYAKLDELKFPKLKYGNDHEENYDYLIRMQIYAFTIEKIEELEKNEKDKRTERDTLDSKTDIDLWRDDLQVFTNTWNKFVERKEQEASEETTISSTSTKGKKKKKAKK